MQVACSTSDTGTLAEGKSDPGDFSPGPGPPPPSTFREDLQASPVAGTGVARSALTSPTSSFGQQKQQAAGLVQVGSGTWGNLPVDDLGGDANGFGRGVSDSEGIDGNSEAELDSGSESTGDDSDEDLDQALAGPTKTLFVSFQLISFSELTQN